MTVESGGQAGNGGVLDRPAAEGPTGGIFDPLGRLLRLFSRLGGVALLALAVLIATDVAFRWLSGRPILGVFEFSEILLLAMTFLAIAYVQFTGQQLRIDFLSGRAKGRTASALSALDGLAGLAFFGILLWSSAVDWWEALHAGFLGRGMLQIPTAIPLGFVLVGTALMVTTLLLLLLRAVRQLVLGPPSSGRREGA